MTELNTAVQQPDPGEPQEIDCCPSSSPKAEHQYLLRWAPAPAAAPWHWRVEQEDPQRTLVQAEPGQLTLESAAGLTVWLDHPLSGAYRIRFVREVRLAGRPYDRLSDLNQFWAASDPANPNLFTRSGVLNEYDDLDLYYVGMGGNWNSTTRFRYYNGRGQRQLLGEFTDAQHLLQPNRQYEIVIELGSGGTRFLVDGEPYFQARYAAPPAAGYFGFRTVWSRQVITDFAIMPL